MECNVGINFLGHDASVFFVSLDNKDIFALDNERITRFKHDGESIKDCFCALKEHFQIDQSASRYLFHFSRNTEYTFRKSRYIWDRLLIKELRKVFQLTEIRQQRDMLHLSKKALFLKSLGKLPKSLKLIYLLLKYKLIIKGNDGKVGDLFKSVNKYLDNDLNGEVKNLSFEIRYYDHHRCHCVGAYYFSPFDKCLSISMDFAGDGYFTKSFLCDCENIEEVTTSRLCYYDSGRILSVPQMYMYITGYLGFIQNCDEGKVEALAAYGDKENEIYHNLMKAVSVNEKHEISIDPKVIECLRRQNLDEMKAKVGREGIAAAVQGFLEDFMVGYIEGLIKSYKVENIALSGGVFANVKLNMSLFERTGLEQMYVFPAMNDSGCSAGSLILYLRENGLIAYDYFKDDKFALPYWGPRYSREEILSDIAKFRDVIEVEDIGSGWPEDVAKRICDGQIGAIFHGRMEYGPRALGNRSILADARNPQTRDVLNRVVKNRPFFQPFCPSVLEEDREELFERSYSNKHMTCAFQMKKEYQKKLPSGVHINGTGRPQFVEEKDNPNFYRVIKEIKRITGFGIVVNTSFNRHGRTMVYRPEHAIVDFLDSQMDFVCLEGIMIRRKSKEEIIRRR